MRILVADTFPDSPRAAFSSRGHQCYYEPELSADQLTERLAASSAEVLIVRSTPVTAADFEQADSLRIVIRAGSGTNTIDTAAAGAHGIYVCNVPGGNATAVAELAIGLLLALDRNIADNVTDLRAGRWNKKRYASARGIAGRRIGVIGLGNIGLAFAERAGALGAEIHALSKQHRAPETMRRAGELDITFLDDLNSLARACDVLSLHLPACAATRRLVDRDLLAAMQPGAIVLNTARADLVDERALLEAMDSKGIRAGIDVFADEPAAGEATISSRLAAHPRCYGTHHIGASTAQAQHAVAEEVVRMIDAFQSGAVSHCVNLEQLPYGQRAIQSSPTRLVSASSGGGAQ